jgi:drug/metabolite transporter (DMT)-like permease
MGFSAYLWLLRVCLPLWVSTYAFVNPVVAVLLGWAFGGELLTTRILVATLMIIVSVFLVTIYRTRSSPVTDPSKGLGKCNQGDG